MQMSIVHTNVGTTKVGGVTGAGFKPGQSGNPGGRPKGLTRRVRELVGDDGEAIASYMFSVMSDDREKTADRLEAARWLADRGFGKAVQTMEIDVARQPISIDTSNLSGDELDTLISLVEKTLPGQMPDLQLVQGTDEAATTERFPPG